MYLLFYFKCFKLVGTAQMLKFKITRCYPLFVSAHTHNIILVIYIFKIYSLVWFQNFLNIFTSNI